MSIIAPGYSVNMTHYLYIVAVVFTVANNNFWLMIKGQVNTGLCYLSAAYLMYIHTEYILNLNRLMLMSVFREIYVIITLAVDKVILLNDFIFKFLINYNCKNCLIGLKTHA